MKHSAQPIAKDLVLVGGGHSHAIALRQFGMHPLPGVRLTLITDASDTPYSGMLPGYVAGFYRYADCHIDLRQLAHFAGAQLYIDRAVGLDLAAQQVLCAQRPPVRFDWLSIDIGSTPQQPAGLGDPALIIPAKPVRQFLDRWAQIVARVAAQPEQPIGLVIVGGGAGGVELAFTMQRHIQDLLRQAGQPTSQLTLHVIHRHMTLLPKQGEWASRHVEHLLRQRGVQLHLGEEVVAVESGWVRCQSGLQLACDRVIWVTHAAAPDWLRASGLAVDADGFILVDDRLQSVSHAQVLAAGDIASMVNHPRPKAGVFAVRQGKPLFHNLRHLAQGQPLQRFQPQRYYLSLIGTADDSAIAVWRGWGWRSPLLWRWKDWIDRRFMQQFHALPVMSSQPPTTVPGEPSVIPPAMRCAGCGAKVGQSILERVLRRIQADQPIGLERQDVLVGLETPDDAAVIEVPCDLVLVQTVDYFPALLNDPFLVGQITTNHALSDLYAMGAQPHSALALATVPYGAAAAVEETLYQLLSGALLVLHQAQAVLLGGHTTEGSDLAFGLTCNGLAPQERLLRKNGLQPGQALILTKPLGTGALFAAAMQHRAEPQWIDGAIASMLQSNQQAAACFLAHQATGCTDVTGFGLLGHLVEMMQASNLSVRLNLSTIPLLDGALETVQQGIVSSLQAQNLRARQFIENLAAIAHHPRFPLLFDPQTSGGLLGSVPQAQADGCLTALHAAGYTHSSIIGMTEPQTEAIWVKLTA